MRVVQVNGSTQRVSLALAQMGQPKPGPGQILIKVHAAGVTTTELKWYPTPHMPSGQHRAHAIPGYELSGVVTELGEGASGFALGEEVFGMNDWFQYSAMAEYCLTSPWSISSKPERLTHVGAAAELIDEDRLKLFVKGLLPLERAADAFAGVVE